MTQNEKEFIERAVFEFKEQGFHIGYKNQGLVWLPETISRAIQFGRTQEREDIWNTLISSMPSDAENLSTLTDWQARTTIQNFLMRSTSKREYKEPELLCGCEHFTRPEAVGAKWFCQEHGSMSFGTMKDKE